MDGPWFINSSISNYSHSLIEIDFKPWLEGSGIVQVDKGLTKMKLNENTKLTKYLMIFMLYTQFDCAFISAWTKIYLLFEYILNWGMIWMSFENHLRNKYILFHYNNSIHTMTPSIVIFLNLSLPLFPVARHSSQLINMCT